MKGLIFVLITSTTLVACGEGDLPNTSQVQQASVSSAEPSAVTPVPLQITASLNTIGLKQTTSFTATGGEGSYTYGLLGPSAGTLSANVFTASIVGETVTVRVTDKKGATADVTISVTWPALQEIFRGRRSDGYHYYTSNKSDGVYAGYASQGVGFRLLQNAIDDQTKPYYQCFVSQTGLYFNSDKSDCEGYQYRGTLGHIYKTQRPGLVAVRRFHSNPSGYDHIDSIKDTADADVSGYVGEGIQGYAIPPL